MSIDEIINSNNLPLMKQHLRRLYDNYELATKREIKNVAEKIKLLKEIEHLKNPNNMNQFKQYRRKQIAELRPVTDAEVMSRSLDSRISLSPTDKENGSPLIGDMIARNPKNHEDQWLVAKQYFEDNFEPIDLLSKQKQSEVSEEEITSKYVEIQSLKEEVEGLKDKYNKLFYETPQDFIKANIELKNENESLQSELDEVKGEKEDFKLALEQIRTSCNPEESSHELFWHISQGVLTKYTNSEEGKEVKDV